MEILDMRGKPCPMPVIEAKKALAASGADVTVLVDNAAAVQNLKKMADGLGYSFAEQKEDAGLFSVRVCAGGKAPAADETRVATPAAAQAAGGGFVVLITSDHMGRGSEDLGRMLIKGFLFSLTELDVPPKAVIFLNGGVNLTTAGANTIDDLKTLEQKGTEVFSCGTCLGYYNLAERLAVGRVTDMMHITKALADAGSVVTL